MKIQLLLTPYPLDKVDLQGKTAVVIDVLRASTTICASLGAGARSIIPTARPGEAAELRAKLGPDSAVLAGERQGVKIENFQFGNSPAEFTPDAVGGKDVILCTTNGSGVFARAAGADRTFSAAFVNVSRVAEELARVGRDTVVICAGREGGFSIEDTLCAGLLIHRLGEKPGGVMELNDAGDLARLLYEDKAVTLHQAVAEGEHGRFLISIGMESDLEICTAVDSMPVLPAMRDGRLVKEDGDTPA